MSELSELSELKMSDVPVTVRDGRHCAYCLIATPPNAMKVCGKCRRRAYCSKECQAKDWPLRQRTGPPQTRGQGHKNWCGVTYCEEGIDWKVSPLLKGQPQLGIFALRPIPAMSRIMVEARQKPADLNVHPGRPDLDKARGDAPRMILHDAPGEEEARGAYICMRISRVRQNCSANSAILTEKEFGVTILFATRDIAEGEEIFTSYLPFNNLTCPVSGWQRRKALGSYGITCPLSCPCRDRQLLKLVEESRELDATMRSFDHTPLELAPHPDNILKWVKRMLEIFEQTKPSALVMQRTMMDGARAAMSQKKTLPLAREYWRKCADISIALLHPKNTESLWFEEVIKTDMKDLWDYLCVDNGGLNFAAAMPYAVKQSYDNEHRNWSKK